MFTLSPVSGVCSLIFDAVATIQSVFLTLCSVTGSSVLQPGKSSPVDVA